MVTRVSDVGHAIYAAVITRVKTCATIDLSVPRCEPRFSVFGWSVTADPDRAWEFLDLKDVSASGFTITGSGLTRVTTPPLFRGARAVTVLINGVPSSVKPDATGRLLVVRFVRR